MTVAEAQIEILRQQRKEFPAQTLLLKEIAFYEGEIVSNIARIEADRASIAARSEENADMEAILAKLKAALTQIAQ